MILSAKLLAAWRHYADAAQALRIPEVDAALDELELWHTTLSGINPMRAALDCALQLLEQDFAARAAALAEERRLLGLEQDELHAERARLEAGEDQAPPLPYTRDASIRAEAAGAPLWQLVDFASHVPTDARAGVEAALEASGLLDAWVLPEGNVIHARTHDVILTVRPPSANSLADWLTPTIPDVGGGASIDAHTLSALLRSVACAEHEPVDVETWISPSGQIFLSP